MPQRDQRGPQGNGPKTGRGMGNCASKDDVQKKNVSQQALRNVRGGKRGCPQRVGTQNNS